MPIILKTTVRIGKKSNILYIKVYFIVINNNRYYIYAVLEIGLYTCT